MAVLYHTLEQECHQIRQKTPSPALYMKISMVHEKEWKKWYKSKYVLTNTSNSVPWPRNQGVVLAQGGD